MTTNAEQHYEIWPSKMAEAREAAPDVMKSFGAMFQKLMGEGALTVREKELIALGMGLALRCEPCLKMHVKNARKKGFTQDEIDEAAWMGIAFGGSPTMVFYEQNKG